MCRGQRRGSPWRPYGPDADLRRVGVNRAQTYQRTMTTEVARTQPGACLHSRGTIRPVTPLTALDLFAGCGGLSLGLHWSGWSVVAAVERSPMAAETYFCNFMGSPSMWAKHVSLGARESLAAGLMVDSVEVLPQHLDVIDEQLPDGLDLLAGGPPCQGFSLAGKRAKDDVRNRLVWRFLDVARELEPRIVVMENVPSIHSPFEHGSRASTLSDLSMALKKLPGPGYVPVVLLLRSDQYGVPQRRKRVFLLGIRADIASRLNVLEGSWDQESEPLNPMRHPLAPPPSSEDFTTLDALWDIEEATYRHFEDAPSYVDPSFARWARSDLTVRPTSSWSLIPNHTFRRHNPETEARFRLIRLFGEKGISGDLFKDAARIPEVVLEHHLAPLEACLPIDLEGIRITSIAELRMRVTRLASKKHSQRWLAPSAPSPTITTLPDDFVHYGQNRTLTVREMARLQSFPDSFVFCGKETTGGEKRRTEVPQYTQVGNAVPPRLSAALGGHLRRLLASVREPQGASPTEGHRARSAVRATLLADGGGKIEQTKRVFHFQSVGGSGTS